MTRESGSTESRPVRRPIRGVAATTLVGIGLCATAAAQDPAPEPPPLSPLSIALPTQPPSEESGLKLPYLDAWNPLSHAPSREVLRKQSRAQLVMAEAHRKRGNNERAYEYYQAAIESDPDNVPARLGLAWACHRRGQTGEAWREIDTVTRLHPESAASAHAMRAYIHAGLGDAVSLERAAADLKQALDRGPLEPRARLARAMIASKEGRYSEAIPTLDDLIEQGFEPAEALIHRSGAFLEQGDCDRALADLERADSLHPGWLRPMLLWQRGRCFSDRGESDRAIADFTGAMAGYRDNPVLYGLRALCFFQKGDWQSALADYDAIVRLRPRDPDVYAHRSLILLELGDRARALAELDRMVQLSPDASGAYFYRAVILLIAAKDRENALTDMNRAIRLNPWSSFFYAFRGFLRARESRFVPAFLDLATFGLTYDPTQYYVFGGVDWEKRRFRFGIGWHAKDDSDTPEKAAANPDRDCIALGFQQLIAAAFGATAR